MPAEWTGANLTFAISTDGNGFNDLFDLEGNEITIVVKPGAAVRIGREWASFWNFIKFRSGPRPSGRATGATRVCDHAEHRRGRTAGRAQRGR